MLVSGKAVAGAWCKARAKIGATVIKDAKGNFGKYATLAAVMEAITPALSESGLAFVQEAELTDDMQVAIAATLLHESGEFIEFAKLVMPVAQKTAQGVGSAMTYARRYQITGLFGLAPDDDDGQAASTPLQRTVPAKPQSNNSNNGVVSRNGGAAKPAGKPEVQFIQKEATTPQGPSNAVVEQAPLDPDTDAALPDEAAGAAHEAADAIIGTWTSPASAQQWAVDTGAYPDLAAARKSWAEMVPAVVGKASFTKADLPKLFTAWYEAAA